MYHGKTCTVYLTGPENRTKTITESFEVHLFGRRRDIADNHKGLEQEQEEKLAQILGNYKIAIKWTLADIKELIPSACIDRILLEGARPIRQLQRRLNPLMMEVVQKKFRNFLMQESFT